MVEMYLLWCLHQNFSTFFKIKLVKKSWEPQTALKLIDSRLREAEKELNQVTGLLREKQKKLAEVEAMIADLEKKFNSSVAEKQSLEDAMELTAARLVRAGRLNIALGDEQIRWEQGVEVNNESSKP